MPLTGNDIADEIRRTLRVLTITVGVCLLLSLAVAGYALSLAARIGRESDKTTSALCTFRADLQTRVTQTETFLLDHPKGFAGIPAETLRQSLDGQRRTILSLATLDCPLETGATGAAGATGAQGAQGSQGLQGQQGQQGVQGRDGSP